MRLWMGPDEGTHCTLSEGCCGLVEKGNLLNHPLKESHPRDQEFIHQSTKKFTLE